MGEIILLIILLLLSAFFSASETALTSLSRIKISRMVEGKVRGAKLVEKLRKSPGDMLSTILIGNNLVNVAASVLAASIVIRYLEKMGWGGIGVAVGIATGIMTFLILIFGEITPKTIAIRNAERLSLWVAPFIFGLELILKPIAYLLGFLSRPFIILLGGKIPEKGPLITEEEIKSLLATGERAGVIEEEEREMITSIFEFGDTIVREVMTPRPDITALEIATPLSSVVKTILESGHSRIPIYEGNLDNIIGVVYAKDLLEEKKEIKEILRPAIFIPESKKISDLLHEMQSARTHLAIIVDEYGMTSGLVTLEDLIEEVVGEIHDEFEREEKLIEMLDKESALVDGKITLKDLNDRLRFDLPEEEYDTMAGFVFGQLGKVPSVGDSVGYSNLLITVERIHRRRITRVKIVKLPRTGEEAVGG